MKIIVVIVIIILLYRFFLKDDNENQFNENNYSSNHTQRENNRTHSTTENDYISYLNQREAQRTNSASVSEPHVETNNANSNCNGVNTASNSYRPTASKQNNSNIIFRTTEFTTKKTNNKHNSNELDLKGLHDAFTGAPLDESLGLNQCETCKVYYHTESFKILQKENSSKCVACQTAKIIEVVINRKSTGKDYTPAIANLSNYKKHVGQVVTFEGKICLVRRSSSSNGMALMFEHKSWCSGFKLVFLGKYAREFGGVEYLISLIRKTVKVRGLIVKHDIFGYQIVISEKSMILGVS